MTPLREILLTCMGKWLSLVPSQPFILQVLSETPMLRQTAVVADAPRQACCVQAPGSPLHNLLCSTI